MVLKILIVISILFQAVAAILALRLIKATRYNISWMLFTAAFVAMGITQICHFVALVGGGGWQLPPYFFAWTGILISLCLAVGTIFISKIFDLIRRLNFQRQLTERRILSTVLRTEEKERQRFSKELHDGLGPLLSSAKMSLSELSRSGHSAEDTELIANTNYVIEEAIRSLREISNNLSPHTLKSFGLARAIASFIKNSLSIKALRDVKIGFETNLEDERFDSNVEVIVYRVVCELINNSLKHSGASDISLSLRREGDLLKIRYADNGKGFNTQGALDTGMGLANISSRINSLEGEIVLRSSEGHGMSAEIKVNVVQVYDNSNEKI
jgi:signal transduction histidine kinase